jgi:vomeronasal 2 receptor
MRSHIGRHTATHGGGNLDAQYDILNFWNFPSGLGLKVKVGTYSLSAQQGPQFSLCEQMIQWPTGFTMVSCDFPHCFDLS